MRITDYLDSKSKEVNSSRRHVRNFRVFDFSYIPDEPLMRDEAKPIIDACLRYLASRIPNHLLVFGSRGSGKTLMLRYLGRLLTQRHDARILYVNCREHNTSFKILAHLLHVQPRGCSQDELWHRFTRLYAAPTIIILDEVDLISDKDRRRDILYLLSRCPKGYMTVLLSNHPRFLSTLDESVRSSLQPELIHFRNYDAEQIQKILLHRALRGLRRSRRPVIDRIAALTTRLTNSDVRVAIKTLYYTAIEQTDQVQHVFDRARRDLVTDLVSDLNDRCLTMLRATAMLTEPLVKTAYERYRQLSAQLHVEPFSYMYFYTNLSYLQSIGLVMLLSTKVGRTYANRIQLLFDPGILDAIWHMRFGQ